MHLGSSKATIRRLGMSVAGAYAAAATPECELSFGRSPENAVEEGSESDGSSVEDEAEDREKAVENEEREEWNTAVQVRRIGCILTSMSGRHLICFPHSLSLSLTSSLSLFLCLFVALCVCGYPSPFLPSFLSFFFLSSFFFFPFLSPGVFPSFEVSVSFSFLLFLASSYFRASLTAAISSPLTTVSWLSRSLLIDSYLTANNAVIAAAEEGENDRGTEGERESDTDSISSFEDYEYESNDGSDGEGETDILKEKLPRPRSLLHSLELLHDGKTSAAAKLAVLKEIPSLSMKANNLTSSSGLWQSTSDHFDRPDSKHKLVYSLTKAVLRADLAVPESEVSKCL